MPGPVPWDKPNYLNGESAGEGFRPTGLTSYYSQQGQANPYQRRVDPYMEQWKQADQQRQLADRQQLQDLYGQLQKQAAGGMTPQQQQQQDAFLMARQNQQQAAVSQGGSPYARAAANAALSQGGGVQGMQQVQQAGQLQASDMMNARQQMMQVASMQRAQDLQAQGMSAEDAMRQAQLEAQARGMNYAQQMGYAGLENEAGQMNQQAYLDALKRGYLANKASQAANSAQLGGAMSMAGSAIGAGMGMIPRG